MPSRGAVRGDDQQVDLFAIDDFEDAFRDIVRALDQGERFDSFFHQFRVAFRQFLERFDLRLVGNGFI